METEYYKAPKKNYWWVLLIWGLLILNIVMFGINFSEGNWVAWLSAFGIMASIFNVLMHHIEGVDPWN